MSDLSDRIKNEMYVSAESLLDEEFDRAKHLFELYEDNSVALSPKYSDINPEEQILIHLIAHQYMARAEEIESPALPYEYFYERIDAGDSTIRKYFGNFVDEGIVQKTEDGDRELVVERLREVLARLEETQDSE